MDTQQGSPFSWPYFCQRKTIDELKHSLLCANLELRKRDDQLAELKYTLNQTMKERDEAQEKCQRLFFEKQLLFQQQQQQQQQQQVSSSDCEESIVSSVVLDPIPQTTMKLVPEKPLPEKGKLLQAVMKAGPLLQTLFLAGPLPQWKHPPPPLDTLHIPPVTIPSPPLPPPPPPPQNIHQNTLNTCGKVNRKRSLLGGYDTPTETKYQRLV